MGLEDFIDKAKDFASGAEDKAKGLVSDENVDKVADKIKELTPDSVDGLVDKVADKAQELNDRFES